MSNNHEVILVNESTKKEKTENQEIQENQKSQENQKDKSEEKSVSYFQLQYKFANKIDYILIIVASFGSIVAGAAMPLISLLLGAAINNFGPDQDKEELKENVNALAINFVICGIGILLGSFIMYFFWNLVSKRLIQKINTAYFEVLLNQEQGYFDQGEKNEHFVTKINLEIKTIENGVNFKKFLFLFL